MLGLSAVSAPSLGRALLAFDNERSFYLVIIEMAEPSPSIPVRRLFQTLKASSELPWLIMCALALVIVIYLSLSDWQQVRFANEQAKDERITPAAS